MTKSAIQKYVKSVLDNYLNDSRLNYHEAYMFSDKEVEKFFLTEIATIEHIIELLQPIWGDEKK